MPKMSPEWKQRWIDALRSRKYDQGRESLRTRDNKFCCLGVLTDLVIKDGIGEWGLTDDDAVCFYAESEGERNGTFLPDWVKAPTGVSTTGRLGISRHTLATMNDQGFTFEEIANTIEENL